MDRKKFSRVLIANRGEIALRIIRGLRELDIESVAVYSEIDRNAPFVKFADYAYYLGESEPLKSYLNMERIIELAKKSGAQAIHPGYGFLAENPEFAKRCKENDLIFIGPNSEVISMMGDKIAARELAVKLGVPIVPGMKEPSESISDLKHYAREIGFPLLIKAAYGGGGKGMRIVRDPKDLDSSLESAMNEAYSAFGNPTIYLEKYIEEPRHIEIQIACDHFGNGVYFPERECSIQRRYQKLIEESPSTIVDEELRRNIGENALKLALSAGYDSVGTVEFLMDKDRNFYFLEMNTRLQVEHPVTELVTGIDLLKLQVEIAQDIPLSIKQEDIKLKGSAIECRICAEDPFNNFLPDAGKIYYLHEPSGPGVRVDSGIEMGSEIALFYDSLIAKLICWGRDRDEAIKRTMRALNEYIIAGVKTTVTFHKAVISSEEFKEGLTTTNFIKLHLDKLLSKLQIREQEVISAIVGAIDFVKNQPTSSEKKQKVTAKNIWKYYYRFFNF